MSEIMPQDIREWITAMQAKGASPWTIQYCKTSILSAIFTTALNDQVTFIHPCRGVKIPTMPATVRRIVTPEQFEVLYKALPDADARLLVETDIETGMRWGELTEVRVKDLDFTTRILTVSRKVIEVNRKFHPSGGRFLVVNYPKGKKGRRFKLSAQIAAKLQDHVQSAGLGPAWDPTTCCSRGGIKPGRRSLQALPPIRVAVQQVWNDKIQTVHELYLAGAHPP